MEPKLAALRAVALEWMERLAPFRPHLSGAVWGLCLGGLARWLPTVRPRAHASRPPAPPDETVHP